MLTTYYASYELQLPFFLLTAAWRNDCSGVDRCWRFSMSLLNAGETTNYVCTSFLSAQLPLWTNNRQCAECPPPSKFATNLSTTEACDPLVRFGHMDRLAGTYLDFWSGENIVLRSEGSGVSFDDFRLGSTKPALSTLYNVNGPYSQTCSDSRKSNSHGHAGWAGSGDCVDCFGDDCTERSFSNRLAANPVKETHCEARFACSAFEFDQETCDKNFFSTVCNAKGDRADYPRHFSDLPGFAFFKNWPHSYFHSCSTPLNPTNVTTLLTASGHPITAKERLRLRALCQLHKRCVREHPSFHCEPTAFERQAKQAREASGKLDEQTWWNLPVSATSHQWKFGGGFQIGCAIFIFYVIACDIAHVYHTSTQNMLFLDAASRQRRTSASVLPGQSAQHGGGAGGKKDSVLLGGGDGEQDSVWQTCRRTVLGWAARGLQHSVRDGLIPTSFFSTISSVVSMSTPLDVIFNGTIFLIVLQVDNLLVHTRLTEENQKEMAQKYSLVVTAQQHQMLQRQMDVAFWSAWVAMRAGYLAQANVLGDSLRHPDQLYTWDTM